MAIIFSRNISPWRQSVSTGTHIIKFLQSIILKVQCTPKILKCTHQQQREPGNKVFLQVRRGCRGME